MLQKNLRQYTLMLKKKCESLGITISIPRLSISRTNRISIPTESPEVYYRILIFILFLDSFCEQLNDRFLNHKALLKNFACLINTNEVNEIKFKELLKTYSYDIEADEVSAVGEFAIWNQQIKKKLLKMLRKHSLAVMKKYFLPS